MWYFAWILGLTAALALGLINALWYETRRSYEEASPEGGVKRAWGAD